MNFLKKLFVLVLWPTFLLGGPLIHYETFTLKNGLQFILLENKRAPIVSYTTWYKVGSADEVQGKTGLAHYVEHLMESGMPEVQMGQFLEDFNSSGAHSNAFTSQDFTYYYKMTTTDHLELLMRYEAGRLRGMAFNKDKFETEKNVILEERLQGENDPITLANEKLNSLFFTVHPYKNPIIGWEKDIRALTFDDIKEFHKKWYCPNNAFVIISGDFDPKKVRMWAEKYYGNIPVGPKMERNRPQEPLDKPKVKPIIIEHPRAAELYLDYLYPLPNLKRDNYQELLALLLLSEYLNGDFEGSLEEILVHRKKLVSAFHSECAIAQFLDAWSFAIYAKPFTEGSIKKIKDIINTRLLQIAKEGLKLEDLDQARTYICNDIVLSLDDIYGKAVFLGKSLASGLTLEQINSLATDLKKVTSADIQNVIQKYLKEEKVVVGILKQPSPQPSSNKGKP
jgi:zinc protease